MYVIHALAPQQTLCIAGTWAKLSDSEGQHPGESVPGSERAEVSVGRVSIVFVGQFHFLLIYAILKFIL